jgi:hypothetical protein
MTRILLRSLSGGTVPQVTLELDPPSGIDIDDLKKRANEAALGNSPAPPLKWNDGADFGTITLALLGKEGSVNSADVTTPHLCVIGGAPQGESDVVLTLSIASGSVAIKTTDAQSSINALLKTFFWPDSEITPIGTPQRLLLGPSGLELEVKMESVPEQRRYRLVGGRPLASGLDASADYTLTWQQVPWRHALNSPSGSRRDPAHRLQTLREESIKRLANGNEQAPVALIDRFDPTGEDAEVFVAIRRKGDGIEVVERVVPTWSLSLGGADWAPRSLTISADPDSKVFQYSDDGDPFAAPPEKVNVNDHASITHIGWVWNANTPVVRPDLMALAKNPPLLSTGDVPGAGANSPYLWQSARLVVDSVDDKQRSEPGAWVRYRLDPLAERPTAITRDSDETAGLSGPIRLEAFRRIVGRDESVEPWRLELGLLPDTSSHAGRGRLWLHIEPVENSVSTVHLQIAGARVHAASPPLLALQTALNDPAAVPNQSDRRRGLRAGARILFANDRETPAESLAPQYALTVALDGSALRVSAWKSAHNVAVAYIAGPRAGLDAVPPALGNLLPTSADAPGVNPAAPPPDRVRQYGAGRVAIHLLNGIDLRPSAKDLDEKTIVNHRSSTVRVAGQGNLFLPQAEAVAALLPWGRWQVAEGVFTDHKLEVFHRNLVLEALDWAAGGRDRRDMHPRDFSSKEALADLERAVRDRFANAARNLTAGGGTQALAHWLQGVDFRSTGNKVLHPRIALKEKKTPGQSPFTGRPAINFSWHEDEQEDPLPDQIDQTLTLIPSPSNERPKSQPWLEAWLRWTGEAADQPVLTVDRDGSAKRPDQIVVGGTRHGRDDGAAPTGKLHHRRADRPRRSEHEDPRAGRKIGPTQKMQRRGAADAAPGLAAVDSGHDPLLYLHEHAPADS